MNGKKYKLMRKKLDSDLDKERLPIDAIYGIQKNTILLASMKNNAIDRDV